ncbi:cytochrome C biogenesis protein [Patescibacteria group bacterium]|nr:cytochrome C biogenesis protein [Patescibacteria group bacterium]
MESDQQKSKLLLALIGFILLVIIIAGLFFLALSTAGATSLVLSYVAGLSMIFLPCTLPLAFIIVPLTMGQKPKKGLIMALLFGLGISITLAFYGVLTASVGSFLGVDKATRIMFTIAGFAALIFGLSELKLINFTMPGFSGAMPSWIQQRKDYTKIFFIGLFLGNAGVGCPNPAFYVLLTYIASVGNVITGGWLAFIHGVGRATPLVFLAILGLLGINSLKWITERKASVDKIMGWGLVGVGSFILTYGIMGMNWWEDGPIHKAWNDFVFRIAPNLAELEGHDLLVPRGFVDAPLWAGWAFFLGLVTLSIVWYKMRKKTDQNTV